MVGDIELTGNALELPGDDLTLIAYTADPGSPAEDQLRLLAAWTATQRTARDPIPSATVRPPGSTGPRAPPIGLTSPQSPTCPPTSAIAREKRDAPCPTCPP